MRVNHIKWNSIKFIIVALTFKANTAYKIGFHKKYNKKVVFNIFILDLLMVIYDVT